MIPDDQTALQSCDRGLQHMWRGEVEEALTAYDCALAEAVSEDTRELITIRKAEALIAIEREGPEVQALPAIVMRRRSPRHLYLAAYTLMHRFSETLDHKRARFYGEIAQKAAEELAEPLPCVNVLNGLGVIAVVESRFDEASTLFNDAIAMMAFALGDERIDHLRPVVIGNLGGAKVLNGETKEGIRLLLSVLPELDTDDLVTEACLDLCFGYLESGDYQAAENFGRRALAKATMRRQVRNANHLLGEVSMRLERYDEADAFFTVVAGFYPDFKNVKQLLVAVDLCSVVNWKA